jgi:hypothetical protein
MLGCLRPIKEGEVMADDKLPCEATVTKQIDTAAKYNTAQDAMDAADKDAIEAAKKDCDNRETCIGHTEENKILCKFTLVTKTSSAKEVEVAPGPPKEYKWAGSATITGKCECKKIGK